MRNVFTVQMGLPVMMQTTIVSELYGADVEYATKNVLLTTLVSLVTIPLYMILLPLI
jgi:predicted permease